MVKFSRFPAAHIEEVSTGVNDPQGIKEFFEPNKL